MRIKNVAIPFLLSLTVTFLLVFLAYRFSDRPVLKPYEKPTTADTSSAAPAESRPEPSQRGGTAAAPVSPPTAATTVAPAPKRQEKPLTEKQARQIAKAPRSDRQLVETLANEAREPGSPVLEALVRDGRMSPEDARKLKSWTAARKTATASDRVEMVGSIVQETPVRRYRLGDGDESFVLLEMKRRPDGTWDVASVDDTPRSAAVTAPKDALALADAFILSARKGDVATTRRLVADGRVDAATLAGLCMLFDEDIYALRRNEPIRIMFQNEKNAGCLVYLRSKSDGKTAHIGLEMVRDAQGGWKIGAVSLDSLLQEYERNGGLEGGRYFPIVRKPKGGESLALFFGYNDDTLTPRSLRQLAIVAELMKGTDRRLDISGHTDDIGSQRFNYDLSLRRAEAVRRELVRAGVDAARVRVHGFGKMQPLRHFGAGAAPEQVEEARGENRRAEIYLDFTE